MIVTVFRAVQVIDTRADTVFIADRRTAQPWALAFSQLHCWPGFSVLGSEGKRLRETFAQSGFTLHYRGFGPASRLMEPEITRKEQE
ncbi:hypothetical protein [Burkholderia cenocepacia]|uniref:hypothetical protein n=1 Tax=Burkholderia cenocepacia TaxID=95486 RepID=UPI0026530F4D|nr:hypothetical protein [Burkholderia cenocepacia]MDN7457369.1 hypothetical protein [Burkholderia cenocepacia]